MHNQVLVIYPADTELGDVMYPYQEIDKYPYEKLNDTRCQWFLTVPEEEIPLLENEVENYLRKTSNRYLEIIQYRSNHSYNEWKEKYGNCIIDCMSSYIYFTDELNKYLTEIKPLHTHHPCKIQFLKETAEYAIDKQTETYIKDYGFGFFHNPYQIWDYWKIVDEFRFPPGTKFLISQQGEKYNTLLLDVLDIPKTIQNIHELTRVWEYIIFCKDDPMDSRLYTTNSICFSDEWNKHCLVDDLIPILEKIQKQYHNMNYKVSAVDFHW